MKGKSLGELSLVWEITIVLIVKCCLLLLIWYCFFNDPTSPITAHDLADRVFGEIEQGEQP